MIAVIAGVILFSADFLGVSHSKTGTNTTTTSSQGVSSTRSTASTTSTSTSTGGSPKSGSAVLVTSQYSNGTTLKGVYTELALNGTEVATGYTPVTFNTTSGDNYTVTVSDFKNLYFNHWSGGFSSRVLPVAANSSGTTATAVFTTTPQPPPATPYSISVASNDLNGTALSGFVVYLAVDGYTI